MASTLCLNGNLNYKTSIFDRFYTKAVEIVSPRLIPGIHYAFNGPVAGAIELYGTLSVVDYVVLNVCCFFRLPNEKLERKLKAISNAYLREAEMLEGR